MSQQRHPIVRRHAETQVKVGQIRPVTSRPPEKVTRSALREISSSLESPSTFLPWPSLRPRRADWAPTSRTWSGAPATRRFLAEAYPDSSSLPTAMPAPLLHSVCVAPERLAKVEQLAIELYKLAAQQATSSNRKRRRFWGAYLTVDLATAQVAPRLQISTGVSASVREYQ
jgi:hypothetical protein